ncbi:MAG: peptidoglycan D,D-transpeptidase FtsI family protein, partial [Acidimicrobiales bacterium]
LVNPKRGGFLPMPAFMAVRGAPPPPPTPENAAVTRAFEPGSVNKMVTVSAAIESGAIQPTDSFVVPDHLDVAGSTFHDAEPHGTETMSVDRILADSSNVGTIMIAKRLGKERIDHYIRSFGLAAPTNLAFPGESGGLLPRPSQWSGTSLATVPIGQGVAVTALQMLVAYNSIANGGVQVPPVLVKRIVDAKGKPHDLRTPGPRRIVSEATARAVVPMLQHVVSDGTATAAAIPGYSVAGKTGTAQKIRDGGGGYKEGAYLATFAGFLPAQSPRLSAIIVLDEPTPIFGGLVSAPLFSELAGFGARLFRIPPDVPLPSTGTVAPTAASTTTTVAAPAAPTAPGTPSAPVTPTAPVVPGAGSATAAVTPKSNAAAVAAGTLGRPPTSRP